MSNMFLNIVSTFKNDGISAATRQLGAFGKQAGGLGSTLTKVGAALASFGIASKAVEFTKSSIDSARDLERNMYSLNTVFGKMAPIMNEFTRNAHEIGLSQKDAAKATVFLGSVLKQSGFSMEETTRQSQKLVSLGVDLAATYGYDVQEALLGMTALFRGEYDPIEKFGVAMKQSEINAELAARELDHLTGAARRNQEQIIRMELLYERAADATGAFTGQSGNLFVEQMKLQAQFENMQASVGTQLLPVMVSLTEALVPLVDYIGPKIAAAIEDSMPALKELIGFIADMSDKSTSTGETIEMLTGIIGGFFSFIGSNFSALVQLTLLFGGVTVAVKLFTAALALLNFNPVIFGLTAFAAAFIWVSNVNKNLQFQVDKTSASVTSFKTPLMQTAAASEYAASKYGLVSTQLTDISNQAYDASLSLEDVTRAMKGLSPDQAASRARRHAMRDQNRLNRQLGIMTGEPMLGIGGTETPTLEAAEAPKGPTGIQAWLAKADEEAQIAQKRLQLIGMGLSEAVADSITSGADGLVSATEALALLATNTAGYLAHFTDLFNRSAKGQALAASEAEEQTKKAADKAEEQQKKAADKAKEREKKAAAALKEANKIAEEARRKEQEIIDKRKAAFESFSDSVKSIFGGIKESIMSSFSLPDLGNSVNSITRNIKKLLERTKDFAKNITSLSKQGLSNELLQQVIAAGPIAGSRLAQSLATAGGGTIRDLNRSFAEFGGIASGIAGVGTRSEFANRQVVNNYKIEVNGGVGSGPSIGKAIVDAIKSYERTSGAVWQGA
jgi:hypothetical protein